MNPLTDSGARILGLTQLLASAELRLAARQAVAGRQLDDDIHVNNFSKMLTDSLDLPGRLAELEANNERLKADLYERDVIIAGQQLELTRRIPEADYTELQNRHTRVVAEVDKLKKKLEHYEKKEK